MSSRDPLRRIAALREAARRLAESTSTGRVVLAHLARMVDPALVPEALHDRLDELRGGEAGLPGLPPLNGEQLRRALADAWDADPLDELDELDEAPAAVTPGAQVHRAGLDGRPVAVKVLRPGLAASFRQDLALVEALATPLSAAFPALDAGALIAEVRERILDELDLEHEAAAQRRVHRAVRRHPSFEVPAPVSRLATEGVMVSDWAEGTPLLDAADPDAAAAQLLLFVVGAAREGIVYADVDPDNFLIRRDGGLTVLDFGAHAVIERGRTETLAEMVEAFAAGDGAALGEATAALGALPAERGPEALALIRDVLGELAEEAPSRLDAAAVIAAGERAEARQDAILKLILAGRMPPQDLWAARGTVQLFATIARLGATGAWRDLVLRALRGGWS